jgi:hypothetical protein
VCGPVLRANLPPKLSPSFWGDNQLNFFITGRAMIHLKEADFLMLLKEAFN